MIGSRKQPIAQSHNDINDAIRFNAFSLERQQEDKILFVKTLIFLMNLIAVIFDSFLHVNLGRDYANPIKYLWSLIENVIDFVVVAVIFLALVIGYFTYNGHSNAFTVTFEHLKDIFYSDVVRWFFGVGFMVMMVQAIYAFLTFSKNKRFSYSNGTPWLYYITRIPFFKDSKYILYIEPSIIISSSVALYMIGYDAAKYIAFFGVAYLIRNIYVYSIIDKGKLQRNDMEVQAMAENSSQLEKQNPTMAGSRAKSFAPAKVDRIEDFIE